MQADDTGSRLHQAHLLGVQADQGHMALVAKEGGHCRHVSRTGGSRAISRAGCCQPASQPATMIAEAALQHHQPINSAPPTHWAAGCAGWSQSSQSSSRRATGAARPCGPLLATPHQAGRKTCASPSARPARTHQGQRGMVNHGMKLEVRAAPACHRCMAQMAGSRAAVPYLNKQTPVRPTLLPPSVNAALCTGMSSMNQLATRGFLDRRSIKRRQLGEAVGCSPQRL